MKKAYYRAYRKNMATLRYTEQKFAPYVIGVGQAALAWNALHESAGLLFSEIVITACKIKTDWHDRKEIDHRFAVQRMALGMWNSPNMDRAKRELLRAAKNNLTPEQVSTYPRLKDDLEWLLKESDALEDVRNDVVHSPITEIQWVSVGGSLDDPGASGSAIAADVIGGNRRAAKLSAKPILARYRYCRDTAADLNYFCELLFSAIRRADTTPWPDKPTLPNQGQKRAPKSRRSAPKRHAHRPPTSTQ